MSSARKAADAEGLRRFRPYPAYKDSGVEWLGKIPEHWGAVRLKRVFSVVSGSTPQSGVPEFWDGEIPWVTPEDLGGLDASEILGARRCITEAGYRSCGTTLVPVGSLVLSTRAPIGHLAIAAVDLCTNQGCRSLVFRGDSIRRFFFFQLIAARPEFQSLGQGSTFKELSKDKLEDVFITAPPENEQRAVAVFLDRETARIDALVAKKERVIELLQEKRTALISRAVTKGLDPNVPMKDSGVEWLGEVPAHWEMTRFKHLLQGTIQNGLFKKKELFGSGTLLINVFDVYRDDFLVNQENLERVEADEAEQRLYSVKPGDIFFVRSSLKLEGIGRAVCAIAMPEPAVFECHLVRAQPSTAFIDSQYLISFLNSLSARQRLVSLANTVTMSTIPQAAIATLQVPVPPPAEQRSIRAHLAQELGKLEKLVKQIQGAIDRLKELRAALISAAVTGKIDVREKVA